MGEPGAGLHLIGHSEHAPRDDPARSAITREEFRWATGQPNKVPADPSRPAARRLFGYA